MKLLLSTPENIPPLIHQKILSALQQHWPKGFEGENEGRTWLNRSEYHPIHVILIDNDRLVGQVAVVWKMLTYQQKVYKTYGLSGLFINPLYQRRGHAVQLAKEAKAYIEKQDADLVLFTSSYVHLYEKAGFSLLEGTQLQFGNGHTPQIDPEPVLSLFISEHAKKHYKSFTNAVIYFGQRLW